MIDHADGQLAAGDELFDEVRHTRIDVKVLPSVHEKQTAARATGDRLEHHAVIFVEHFADRLRSAHDARLGHSHAVAQRVLRVLFVESSRARDGTRSGERDSALLHHSLKCAVLANASMEREQEHRIIDRQGIEGLFDVRPDRRPLRLKIDLKWALMREKIIDGDIMNRPVRSPEPGEWRAECTDDVLSRCDRHMPLVGRAAE